MSLLNFALTGSSGHSANEASQEITLTQFKLHIIANSVCSHSPCPVNKGKPKFWRDSTYQGMAAKGRGNK